MGRLKGNISCNHIAPINVSIESISCELNGKTNKNISYKLNYKDLEHLVDSEYSCVNTGKLKKSEDCTSYEWFCSDTKDKTDLLEINDVKTYAYT